MLLTWVPFIHCSLLLATPRHIYELLLWHLLGKYYFKEEKFVIKTARDV